MSNENNCKNVRARFTSPACDRSDEERVWDRCCRRSAGAVAEISRPSCKPDRSRGGTRISGTVAPTTTHAFNFTLSCFSCVIRAYKACILINNEIPYLNKHSCWGNQCRLKRCSHCARHRTTSDDVVRCRAQCEHRLRANKIDNNYDSLIADVFPVCGASELSRQVVDDDKFVTFLWRHVMSRPSRATFSLPDFQTTWLIATTKKWYCHKLFSCYCCLAAGSCDSAPPGGVHLR